MRFIIIMTAITPNVNYNEAGSSFFIIGISPSVEFVGIFSMFSEDIINNYFILSFQSFNQF